MRGITNDGDNMQINQDRMLTREQTARALTEAGYPIAIGTLARKACCGGGPPFHQFGGIKTLYPWGTSLAWARSRLSRRVTCTSEFDAA